MKKTVALFLGLALSPIVGINVASAQFSGLPDSSLTPGAFNPAVDQSTIQSTICVSGYTATIRPPASYTTNLKIKQLNSGYSVNGDVKTSDYEEDHLVPLEIGGDPKSPLNLWPELWNGGVGAHMKDKLENRIRKLICNGSITLTAAQAIFTSNWEIGYQKWIGALTISTSSLTTRMPAPHRRAAAKDASKPIHPGAFCSNEGAKGMSKAGKSYTCKASTTDSRDRWRK